MTTSASKQSWAAITTAARAEALTKIYGEGDTSVVALDAVSCAFSRGHYTAIMGPSGSGKSTLMHCMAGLDSATSGSVFIGDTDLTALDDNGWGSSSRPSTWSRPSPPRRTSSCRCCSVVVTPIPTGPPR